jgi:DNA-binding MarR family transcriptional regulator
MLLAMQPRGGSRVQREIRQTQPFRSRSQEAVIALLRTAEVVRRFLTASVAPAGLTLQQYNVLRILRGAGPAGLPTLDVADRMIEHAPGITRMMDRLEAQGWVTRERCPTDRREVHCRITGTGLGLLERLDPTVDETDRLAMGALDDRSLQRLIAMLDRVRTAHAAVPGSPPGKRRAREPV